MARRMSATKHQAILETALAAFLANGYLGTSMDEIAAGAGVSKQTLYKHFADKERLFADMLLATTGQIEQLVRWIVEGFRGASGIEEDLNRLASRFLGMLMEPRVLRLRRLVIANADRFPALGRAWYERGFERVLATLADCFHRFREEGALAIDDTLGAANHFVGMLLWIPINRAMFTGDERLYTKTELDRFARAAVSAFLRAYGTHALERRSGRRGAPNKPTVR